MINREKTLVILSPGFPANEQDTTCIPSQQLFVKALKENSSHNIIVLAFQYPFVKERYQWHGIDVIAFNGRNKRRLSRIRLWEKVWKTLKKLKRDHNIIGILSFWLGECALIGKYFARRNNLKQYTWILGQDAKKGNKYTRLIKPDASNLIALSDFVADEFLKNYSIKPQHIIPVGIDTTMFETGIKPRDIDIMGAGSLIPLKRYDLFIEIINELVMTFPDLKVVICGGGIEKQKLLTQITGLNLHRNIIMPGQLPHQEILAMMQRSKIFMHTSSYEGYGAVHAEALYAGCYLISFCKPMKKDNCHEYIASTQKDAVDSSRKILELATREHTTVLSYDVKDIAKTVADLFT